MSLSAAIGFIGGFNECVTLWRWAKSAIVSLHSRWSCSQEQALQGRVLELESGLKRLRDTLPAMHDLINKAEWRSHDDAVANLLPNLKDAVFDAEDLLDEFGWYEKKVQVEGDASQSPFIEFFDTVIQGSFNKLDGIQLRLNHLSSQLESMGLCEVTQRFDKSVRPETTSLPNETQIFGRVKELKQLVEFLNVRTNSKRKRPTGSVNASTSTLASKKVSNEPRKSGLPVLPIVGIGGLGKSTLAQHICSHQRVKSHFEKIIWICVSDDFDVKRLTKEVIQSFNGNEATTDNLNNLQEILSNHVNNRRLLIVLDDMWEDALKENGQCWRRFCAPFRSVQEGSMMLVTTRCSKVTEGVRTMEPMILEGLKDDIFWNFFKSCVFGSESSDNDSELECIGRRILPKLKGSPLAAKTLGRMLSMNLQASHWNFVLASEMWELEQEETDILPALRLSYMYLPFYLKQCFAFCAMYPKDYIFEKAWLAEIWAAEGFVEPRGDLPIQDIGCLYFEDLVARSFFQKDNRGYIIHDLLHDLAKKVSEQDCFIIRYESDFDKVPPNVRHLFVARGSDFDDSNLLRLCKYTKLRTLICMKNLGGRTDFVIDQWCTKLPRMRVVSCIFTNEVQDSIGNWKHLRYLNISYGSILKTIPTTFCRLCNLQILYARILESLPSDFGKVVSLQKFESYGLLLYWAGGHMDLDLADGQRQGIGLIKNLNQFRGHLEISNVGMVSKDQAAQVELKNKKYLDKLTLNMASRVRSFRSSQIIQNNETEEVLKVLQPPISLKSLFLRNYDGISLPCWLQPQNLPSLKSLTFANCFGLIDGCFPRITERINSNDILAVGVFMSLTDVTIDGCESITSLECFLNPDCLPAIKKIRIENCKRLASVPTEEFGDLHFLEELDVCRCPNIRLQRLFSPSLKKLSLRGPGLFCNIDCCSLTYFHLDCDFVTSMQLEIWSLPSLQELQISCKSLASIGGTTFSSLNILTVVFCDKLSTLDDLLKQEYLPAIEKIQVKYCPELLSLPVERFISFLCLNHLLVYECPSLNWQMGLVLPSHLRSLSLQRCGDISPYVPSCLHNLTSLVSLGIGGPGIISIPGDIWCCNLESLEELRILDCPDLVSIGGAKAVAKIKEVVILQCPNLMEVEQINRRSRLWGRTR